MRNNHHSRRHCHHRHHQNHHCYNYQQQQQQDQHVPLPSGAIFMCKNKTRNECLRRRIFGLPAWREPFIRLVKEGMYLFLFDADDREMHGVFKAASNGGMNIVPEAFSSSGSRYPAQVQFNILYTCKPLRESEFKPAIRKKYFNDVMFNFDLNSDQVQRLLVLFEAKKVSGVPQSITDRWDPSSSIDSPLNRDYSNRQHDVMSDINTLGHTTLHVQIAKPYRNTEGAMLFITSDMNLLTPGNINLSLNPNIDSRGLGELQLQYNSSSNLDHNLSLDPNMSLNPNSNPNSSFHTGAEKKESVFSRLSQNHQRAAREREPCLSPTINQLPGHLFQQSSHHTGLNRAVKSPAYIHGLDSADISAGPDMPGVVDRMGVDPTSPESNLTVVPGDTQLPFLNFKRRNEGKNFSPSPELEGDKKKRRLIRPSLELEDQDSDLRVFEGHMHKIDTYFDEPLKKPSLVSSIESAYNREKTVITDTMDVEGWVDSGNSEVLQSPVCKTRAVSQTEVELVGATHQGLQGNLEGKKVLRNSVGTERGKGDQDLDIFQGPICIVSQSKLSDSYSKGEPLGPTIGEYRDESNELLVSLEIEKQKKDFEDLQGPLFKSDICPEKIPDKTKVEPERVVETKSDYSQMVLVSRSEKLGTVELVPESLNEEGANFSEGQTESFVLGEKTEKEKPVPDPEPINSEPKIEIKYNIVHQPEPDNTKISLNVVEEYIALEPEADDLNTTGLFLHKEKSNPVEDYIPLEPEAD